MNDKSLITININNVNILTKKNITIIQACLNSNLNIDIPRFCFHEKLSIAGNCRMCLVEVLKSPKPVVACAMQVMDGMVVKTNTTLVKKAREGVLEFLLANHPLDCPICDQGGECDLQDQSMIFGGDIGRFYEYKRSVENKDCGPLIKTVMTRCIHCTRCVRFLNEVAGIRTLGVVGRGNKMEIGTYLEKVLNTELSGNIIDLCPVGALTSKPYAFTARSWELISKDSVDIIDSLGSDIKVDIRGTEVMRILPRLNEQVNDNWISDITRFYYDSIVKQRLVVPYWKGKGNKYIKSNWSNVLNYIWSFYYINKFILKKEISFLPTNGSLSDVQSLVLLKELNSFFNNKGLISKPNNFNNDLRQNYLLKFKKAELMKSDLVILVGSNLRLESPLYNYRIRRLHLKKKALIVSFGSTINLGYKVTHVGVGLKSFLRFIEGNHYLCNLFLRSNNPVLLFGGNIFERFDYNSILKLALFLKINYKNDLNYGLILKNIGDITSLEVNSNTLGYKKVNLDNNSVNIFSKPVNFIYSLNKYSLEAKKNDFTIFQGHHWDSSLNNINLLLPGVLSFEKNSNYISLEGLNRHVEVILSKEKNMREDWQIILAIIAKINYTLSKKSLTNLNIYLKNNFLNIFKNKLNDLNSINLILSILLFKNKDYFYLLKFNNEVFNKKVLNTYLSFFINDISFNNILELEKVSPILANKNYVNINDFILCDNVNKLKLFNSNFNSCVDSIYKQNILTRTSNTLSLTHNRFKLFDTNYI